MPFHLSADQSACPRVLVINPNSTVVSNRQGADFSRWVTDITDFQAFTEAMMSALRATDVQLDFYTAPTDTAPASIEGTYDSVVSAAACLKELRTEVGKWDGVGADLFCRSG